MPLSTRITVMLGIEKPILLAPMDLISDGKLASAVTNAGGFGIIGGGYGNEEWLRREIAVAGRSKIGVGFITWSLAKKPQLLDVALEYSPKAIMLSFGDISPFVDRVKQASALLICQVQTVEQAKTAVALGADILVAQGGEAGGHGVSRGTFALVPSVCDVAGKVPVVASGGVADGRGLAAALMLGADGVLVGTRFYATQEAAGTMAAKETIVVGSGDRTIRSIIFDIARRNVWPSPYTGRVLQNEFSDKWRGRESELLQSDTEAQRYAEARERGDYRTAAVIAGECVDLVHDIPSAADVVNRISNEAHALLSGMTNRALTAP